MLCECVCACVRRYVCVCVCITMGIVAYRFMYRQNADLAGIVLRVSVGLFK